MKQRIRLTESDLHRIVKESVKRALREETANDEYQVNVSETVDGQTVAWVSRYDSNGYVGKTTDTVYADGADTTDWCIYSGSKEECEDYAFRINNGSTKY